MMKIKKLLTKVACVLLAAVSFCTFAVGCNETEQPTAKKKTYTQSIYGEGTVSTAGTHIQEVTETEKYIIKDSRTDYKIVTGKDSTTAVQYLQQFIREATGCYIGVCKEEDVVNYGLNSKYIFVGQTKFDEPAQVSYTLNELGTNGFKIKSVGTNYFLGAVYNRGVSYAAFEFLHHLIGFEQYSPTYTYYERSKDVPFYEMNIVEIPDYEWRQIGNAAYDALSTLALRMNAQREIFAVKVDAEGKEIPWVHNSLSYLPPSIYRADHPNWYSTGAVAAADLCYTAHGDQTEYNLMVDEAVKVVKNLLIYNPDMNTMSFVNQDIYTLCECTACTAEKEKYGTDSGAYIKFVKAVMKKVNAWVAEGVEIDKDRDYTMYVMAYLPTRDAPTYKDENGNYLPIDEDVIFEDHMGIWLAYSRMDYTHSITEPENQQDYDNTEGWTVLTDKVILWMYLTYFDAMMYPAPFWGTFQELYRYFSDKGANVMFQQGQYGQMGSTAFNDLKVYLSCKLGWNVNLDEKTLMENYFKHVYGPAAETMKAYFDEMNAHLEVVRSVYGAKFEHITTNIEEDQKNFPYPVVQRWLQYIDVAYSKLDTIKDTDPQMYEKHRKMVTMESIFPRYLNVTWYADYYDTETLMALRKSFVEDAAYVRISRISEGQTLESITSAWGLD